MKAYKFKIVLYFLLPFLLWGVFAKYGFEDSDTGFLLGLGWRVVNGEIPYIDFTYVRPFISLYHSAFLIEMIPNHYQMIMIKLVPLLMLSMSVYFISSGIDNKYNLKNIGLDKYDLGIIGFLISSSALSTFMLWHTIDGIFYQSIALWLLTKVNNKNENLIFFIIALFMYFGVLCKQNFLATYVFSCCYVFFTFGFRSTIKYISLYVIFNLLLYFSLIKVGVWDTYIFSTSAKTEIKDIVNSSIKPYLTSIFTLKSIVVLGIVCLVNKYSKNIYLRRFSFYLIPVYFLLVLFFLLYNGLDVNFRITRFDHIIPFFVILYFISFKFIRDFYKNLYVYLLLTLSWSSSVSWGANTPLLAITPVIFCVFYIASLYIGSRVKHLKYAMYMISIIYVAQLITPYRDSPMWELDYDMGNISIKSDGIFTDKDTYLKYVELVDLNKQFNLNKTTILPSMPIAHYLLNKENPFVIDWAMDTESAYTPDELKIKLDKSSAYVFVEKRSIGQPIGSKGSRFYSSISNYVLDKYIKVKDGFYFDVYKNPNLKV